MNEMSVTSMAGATTMAAFAGALVLSMLSRPATPLSASEPHASGVMPGVEISRLAAPRVRTAAATLEGCEFLSPADPSIYEAPVVPLLASSAGTPGGTGPAPGADMATKNECSSGAADNPATSIGGLGSGWIISADGVMQMDPYALSDRHSFAVRLAEPLREFKGRVIGLGAPGTIPQEAQGPAEGPRTRPLLVVGNEAMRAKGGDQQAGREPSPAFSAVAVAMPAAPVPRKTA